MRAAFARAWRAVKPDGPHEVLFAAGLLLLGVGLAGIDWHVAAVVDGLLLAAVGLGFTLARRVP